MAKKPSSETVRRDICTSLLQLEQILQSRTDGIVINPDVLKSAANAVKRNVAGASWAYEVEGLMLRVDLPQNSIPSKCVGPLTIVLDLKLGGDCGERDVGDLTHLIMNLSIESANGDHLCAWHFDRHIEGDEPSADAHPLYHFQNGGHVMKPHNDFLGRALLLPAPRLPFPPMDAVLAIDFVLSNFSGLCWSDLRDEPGYVRLLKESQEAFWKPYLKNLSSWWDVGHKDKKKIISLFPHFV